MMQAKLQKFFQSRFWKRFGTGILLLLVACAFCIATLIHNVKEDARNHVNQVELTGQADGDNETGMNIVASSDQYLKEETVAAISGVQYQRRERDDRLASKMFKYPLTWSSAATYADSRATLLREFDYLDPNGEFLTGFFPPLEVLQPHDASGNLISDPFKLGVNTTFVSFESRVIGIDEDGTYHYFGEITAQSKGPVGGSATFHTAVLYSTDKDGKIINPSFYTLAE